MLHTAPPPRPPPTPLGVAVEMEQWPERDGTGGVSLRSPWALLGKWYVFILFSHVSGVRVSR